MGPEPAASDSLHLAWDHALCRVVVAVFSPRKKGHLWAEFMQRTFGFDVLACPRCGGRLQLIALIDQAAVIQRILRHLGLPAEIPEPRAARAPPLAFDAISLPRTTRSTPTIPARDRGARAVKPEVCPPGRRAYPPDTARTFTPNRNPAIIGAVWCVRVMRAVSVVSAPCARGSVSAGKSAQDTAAALTLGERYKGYDLTNAAANVAIIFRELQATP